MTTRTAFAPIRRLALLALAAMALNGPAALAQEETLTLQEWSDHVWRSALGGDLSGVETYLDRIPDTGHESVLVRVREAAEQFRENRREAQARRAEARDTAATELGQHLLSRQEALDELRRLEDPTDEASTGLRHLAANHLSLALRSAVEVQTLSDDFDVALQSPEIRLAISEAKDGIPAAEKAGDWLLAQELLFRLRTLYDDTAERALYDRYDQQLKAVNRRVMLLALYAPRALHELRGRQADRLGEPALGEYNPVGIENWEQRLHGIDNATLMRALELVAREHIESGHSPDYHTLIDGGLSGLAILATTSALADTFPGLGRAEDVQRWTGFIGAHRDRLARAPHDSLGRKDLAAVLDALDDLNTRTIGIPRQVLYHEFGDGAIYELSAAKQDDYSEIIWPDKLRRFRQQTNGHFVGVGILISYDEKRDITVVNPLEGTPAFRAGVRPDDRIVEVDGVSTVGWTLNDAVDRITGPRGTEVKLGLRRVGQDEILAVTITRDLIRIPSVSGWWKKSLDARGQAEWDWMVDPVGRIAYVRLTGFNEDTHADLLDAWGQMNEEGRVNGLIIDLRHNPGGLLDQAVAVANLFVSNGGIVTIEGKGGRVTERYRATANRDHIVRTSVPVVVLVNKGSASASEIVAGCLQAHDAAVIVGTRTWGKGSVQRVYNLGSDAALKLTTQYYRLPPARGEEIGRLVHKRPNAATWGVDPDIEVDMTPEQIMAAINLRDDADLVLEIGAPAEDDGSERPDVNELITKGIDPQLGAALLILKAKIAPKMAIAGERASLN